METDDQEYETAPESVPNVQDSTPKKSRTGAILAVLIVIFILAGAAYWFVFRKKSDDVSVIKPPEPPGTSDEQTGQTKGPELDTPPIAEDEPINKPVLGGLGDSDKPADKPVDKPADTPPQPLTQPKIVSSILYVYIFADDGLSIKVNNIEVFTQDYTKHAFNDPINGYLSDPLTKKPLMVQSGDRVEFIAKNSKLNPGGIFGAFHWNGKQYDITADKFRCELTPDTKTCSNKGYKNLARYVDKGLNDGYTQVHPAWYNAVNTKLNFWNADAAGIDNPIQLDVSRNEWVWHEGAKAEQDITTNVFTWIAPQAVPYMPEKKQPTEAKLYYSLFANDTLQINLNGEVIFPKKVTYSNLIHMCDYLQDYEGSPVMVKSGDIVEFIIDNSINHQAGGLCGAFSWNAVQYDFTPGNFPCERVATDYKNKSLGRCKTEPRYTYEYVPAYDGRETLIEGLWGNMVQDIANQKEQIRQKNNDGIRREHYHWYDMVNTQFDRFNKAAADKGVPITLKMGKNTWLWSADRSIKDNKIIVAWRAP